MLTTLQPKTLYYDLEALIPLSSPKANRYQGFNVLLAGNGNPFQRRMGPFKIDARP